MEPFGLFNLLKSLLPQAENPTETVDTNDLDSAPQTVSEDKNTPDFSDASQNAFLDFVNRHDERKKNIKKP